jgi:uncharacterized membrane protein HdeD (DUF308 family)
MFGYRVEENFDLAKEQRRDLLWWWVVVPGICLLCALYIIHPFSAAILQGYFLTSMSYGDSFYVQRRDSLGKPWLWKAIFATIPPHLLVLLGIVWLDWPFPDFFPKVLVSGPILVVTFGVEEVLFDWIVDRFSPLKPSRPVEV